MPALWVETPLARLRLESERLILTLPAREDAAAPFEHHLPLEEIERLILHENASITTPALCELLRRDIPITLHDASGRCLGVFTPPTQSHCAVRLLQYQKTSDPAFVLGTARILIRAKAGGQRRLLQRLQATRPAVDASPVLQRIEPLLTEIDRAPTLDALRGVEGMISQLFFSMWEQFLPPEFPFAGRSIRPPRNPVNAVLSYASAVLYGELLSACHRRGLDPGLGCLHATQDRRWSLPLDLMEPFRPAVSEALTLRLFAHRMLDGSHFQQRDGGVFLGPAGRRILLADYHKRLHRPFVSSRSSQRTTLRQEMDTTVLSFKASLAGNDFQPFRLQ